jgi:hypothetical protein
MAYKRHRPEETSKSFAPASRAARAAMGKKVVIRYHPYGSIRDLFMDRSPEIIVHGPAGTGKTRGVIEKVHACLTKRPNVRWLMTRKTRQSMTETCISTFTRHVLKPVDHVTWHSVDQKWVYPNGSELVVAGLDNPTKVMSSEYDGFYANEATELSLSDWELVTTRLRNHQMPYQQALGDCNPDAPNHWIMTRHKEGKLVLYQSVHEDNPVLYDHDNSSWTRQGLEYLARLENLGDVRYKRLRLGQWVAAEGAIYESFNQQVHLKDYFPIPDSWPRYWVVDFGMKDPFVWQAWAENPNTHDLYRYREIYMTGRLVEDHAEMIMRLSEGTPKPHFIICDHDLEDRMTLERHLGMSTIPAYKAILPGIEAVKSRMKWAKDADDKLVQAPSIYLMRDSLVEIDQGLKHLGQPYCTEDEMGSYVWDKRRDGSSKGDIPKDQYNHGADAMRYLVAFVDSIAEDPTAIDEMLVLDDEFRVRISPY